jgi:hypothetical protein
MENPDHPSRQPKELLTSMGEYTITQPPVPITAVHKTMNRNLSEATNPLQIETYVRQLGPPP